MPPMPPIQQFISVERRVQIVRARTTGNPCDNVQILQHSSIVLASFQYLHKAPRGAHSPTDARAPNINRHDFRRHQRALVCPVKLNGIHMHNLRIC